MRKHAETIKAIARENGVPILRNVPLAQALNKLDLEEEVPEELYEAVAEVLNFVYELRDKEAKAAEARRKAKQPKTNSIPPSGKGPGNPPR